jgi:hypothetical protein
MTNPFDQTIRRAQKAPGTRYHRLTMKERGRNGKAASTQQPGNKEGHRISRWPSSF